MRDYELTVLLEGSLGEKEVEKETKSLKELLAKAGAKIKKDVAAVKKELAYVIAKNREAFYLYFELEIKPEEAGALEGKLKLQDKVIRYLLIKKE